MRRKVHASGPGPAGAVQAPGPERPVGAGSTGPQRPVGAGTAGPERPVGAGTAGPDWASEATSRLDELVVTIRSNTTDRLVRLARLIVLGLLAAVFGVAAGVLSLIALVRGLDVAIPGPVWEVYLLLGAIVAATGLFLWSRKGPRPRPV